MYSIPDRLEVFDGSGNELLFSGLVQGQNSVTFRFAPDPSGKIIVIVNRGGGISGTAWQYTITITAGSNAVSRTGDTGAVYAGENINDPLGAAAEPIDTGTGAHFFSRSLLKVHGAQDLELIADYDSICRFNGVLGTGWSHNFEARLRPQSNGSILLSWNAKRSNTFVPQTPGGNTFTCPDLPVVYDSLAKNADGTYTLTEPSQRHLHFDASGRLSEVVNAQGQAVHLAYQSTNPYPFQIQEVVSGKALHFDYDTNYNLLSQVSDDSGRTVSFSYDISDHLIRITKADGNSSQTHYFYYDSVGRVLSEINPEGVRVFTDTYDSQGRIATQDDAVYGNRLTYVYYDESQTNRIITTVVDRTGATNIYVHDQRYLLLSVTDGLGHTTSYGYDANGNRTSITNALGNVQRFVYDAAGNVISAADEAGQATISQYDGRNNLLSIRNPAGSVATFAYDANNNVTASMDFMSNVTTLAYGPNSLPSQKISPRGGRTSFAYSGGLLTGVTDAATNATGMAHDAVGRLTAITNGAGFVSTNAYDLNDNLIATGDALGNVWRFTRDSVGRKLSETDPLGNTVWYSYDGNGNLLTRTDPLRNQISYTYDGEDRLASVTDANNHTRWMSYDAAGRLTAVADALNHTNFLRYDAVGNLVASVDALGVTNQITAFDARNLAIATEDALGSRKTLTYDALQRLVQTVDALNRTNRLDYDALNRLIASTDPLSLRTVEQFDADGNRTALTNPRRAPTTFAYDLAERLIGSVTATGRKTSYNLDGRNLLTSVTQPSGSIRQFTYDAAGRLTQSQDPNGVIDYSYDKKGRLLTVSEGGRTVAREYDAADRLVKYTDIYGNVIKYGYDSAGNLTTLTYPDGKTVNYAYDAANRLRSVMDWDYRVTQYVYDANNRVTSITHPNGTRTLRSYDAAGRVKQQQDFGPTNNIIYQVDFTYDAAGQILSETTQPPVPAYQPATVKMAYDPDNCLAVYAGKAVTRDANGNLTSGPLTNNNFATFTYDTRNRLTGAGGVAYAYDPEGNRVAMTNKGTATRLVVNPNAALSQVLVRLKNGVTNYYVYGAGLLYEVATANGVPNVRNYHYDYRGSTVALSDGNGNVTDRMAYAPYGSLTARTGTNDTPFLFNGSYGVMAEPNGLLYMRARFYNSTMGRFLNPDPLKFVGGYNVFEFANNNPLMVSDPMGLSPDIDYLRRVIDQNHKRITEIQAEMNRYENPGEHISRDVGTASLLFSVAKLDFEFKAIVTGPTAIADLTEPFGRAYDFIQAATATGQGDFAGAWNKSRGLLAGCAPLVLDNPEVAVGVGIGNWLVDLGLDLTYHDSYEPLYRQWQSALAKERAYLIQNEQRLQWLTLSQKDENTRNRLVFPMDDMLPGIKHSGQK